jgi:hypothetical protein
LIRWPKRADIRDTVLFVTGLAGVVHETLYASEPRETLLILFAAMMGLPAFLRMDEREPPDEPPK